MTNPPFVPPHPAPPHHPHFVPPQPPAPLHPALYPIPPQSVEPQSEPAATPAGHHALVDSTADMSTIAAGAQTESELIRPFVFPSDAVDDETFPAQDGEASTDRPEATAEADVEEAADYAGGEDTDYEPEAVAVTETEALADAEAVAEPEAVAELSEEQAAAETPTDFAPVDGNDGAATGVDAYAELEIDGADTAETEELGEIDAVADPEPAAEAFEPVEAESDLTVQDAAEPGVDTASDEAALYEAALYDDEAGEPDSADSEGADDTPAAVAEFGAEHVSIETDGDEAPVAEAELTDETELSHESEPAGEAELTGEAAAFDGAEAAAVVDEAGATDEGEAEPIDAELIGETGAVADDADSDDADSDEDEPSLAAVAPTATALRPGDVAEVPIAVWNPETAQRFRDAWRDVQVQFVDDPDSAVAEAQDLVAEAVQALAEALLAEQGNLDPRRVDAPDTESMRIAMRGYKDFLERVLSL